MPTLADTVGNAAAIRAELRALVGHAADTVLCPDATVDAALRRALTTLNGLRPIVGIGTFTTVAGQQKYTPAPSGAFMIRRAWWPLEGCSEYGGFLEALDEYLGQPIDEEGTRTTLEPAAVEALIRVESYLRHRLRGRAHVQEESGTWCVRLDPAPTRAGDTVTFTYSAARYSSAGAVTDVDAERFWTAAEMHLHKALSAGAGGVAEVRDETEGVTIRTDAAKHHLELYKDARARLNRMAPPPAVHGL